jgi:hypothetical protein
LPAIRAHRDVHEVADAVTREQACAELRRRWGQRARYPVGKRLSSPERRQTAAQAIEPLKAEFAVRLERARTVQHEINELKAQTRYDKFEVGHMLSIGFNVCGKGDTWEEACAAADAAAAGPEQASAKPPADRSW